jgi:hypothetical protein
MLPKHRRGPWTTVEDNYLIELVQSQGAANWVRISQIINTRSPKQCRERYHQNLKPSLNLDPITPEEGVLIERMVAEMGKRWAEIARRLHNRSDNAVKNWWNGGMNRRKRLENRRVDYAPRQSAGSGSQQQQQQQQQGQQQMTPQQTPQQQQQIQQQQMPHPQMQPMQPQQQMSQQMPQHMPQQMPQPQAQMMPQQHYQQPQMDVKYQQPQMDIAQQQQTPMAHVSSYDFYPQQRSTQPAHLAPSAMPYGQPQYMNHAQRRIMEQQQPMHSPGNFSSYSRAESAEGPPPSLVSDMSYNSYSHPNTPRGSNDLAPMGAPMGAPMYHTRQISGPQIQNHASSYNVGTSYPAPGMDAQRQAYPLLAEQWQRQSSSPDARGGNQLPFGGQLPLPNFNTASVPGGSPGAESRDRRMKLSSLMS